MFSLSKIKNKKSFFLQIILLSTFNGQSHGNPMYDGYQWIEKTLNDHPLLTSVVTTTTAALIHHAFNIYYEDAETKELARQEKQQAIDIKNHPDYPAITLLHQKNDAEEKANINMQASLTLKVQEAQLLEHYQEKISLFLQCSENGASARERNFCNDMYKIHFDLCKKRFPTQ